MKLPLLNIEGTKTETIDLFNRFPVSEVPVE